MNLGPVEIIIILLIILLLFGAKKLPELARGLGRSASEFKRGMQEDVTEGDSQSSEENK